MALYRVQVVRVDMGGVAGVDGGGEVKMRTRKARERGGKNAE